MTMTFRPLTHGMMIAAVASLGLTIVSVGRTTAPRELSDPPIAPPANPYHETVAARGLVEPASEVIAIAIDNGGVVREVGVVAGDQVKKGDPLFAVDDRDERAAVAFAEADVRATSAAIAAIDHSLVLQNSVIGEAAARVTSAQADTERTALDQKRYQDLVGQGWATHQRFETAKADALRASADLVAVRAALTSARRQIDVLKADRQRATAELERAEATLGRARIDLDKTAVRAPVDGSILKVNVRVGEFADQGVPAEPLMTMGVVDPLHIRVDIDETDAHRIDPDNRAIALLPGVREVTTPLAFVRFEPAVVPKRQLAGGSTPERVDTRVLQAIYAFRPADFPARVGQQVDVFIDAKPVESVSRPRPVDAG
ncbi:MAG: HlyD family secretion protein [Rhodospirillales bacterium]|nr:HlyD family secretion protein [Rhodospirillales bacterium]